MQNPYDITIVSEEFYGEVAGYNAYVTTWSDHVYRVRLSKRLWTWDDIELEVSWDEMPTEEEIVEALNERLALN